MTIASAAGAGFLLAAAAALFAGACASTGAVDEEAVAAGGETPGLAAESAPPPAVYSNTVRWTTASELDNFGYDVYRADSPDGPFERVTREVIEGAGTTDEPTLYRFVDDTVDPRKTYYYYVESISMSGVRERFTPIGEAPPKIAPAEGEEGG